jgi:hypothetical protein
MFLHDNFLSAVNHTPLYNITVLLTGLTIFPKRNDNDMLVQ